VIEPGKYTLKQLNEGAWVLMKYRNAWFVSAYSGAAILWISYFAARTGFGSRSWQWFLSFFVCLLLLAICSWKAYSNEPAIRALVSLGCSAVIFVVVNLILSPGKPWLAYSLAMLFAILPLYVGLQQLRWGKILDKRAVAIGADPIEKSRQFLDFVNAESQMLTWVACSSWLGVETWALQNDGDFVGVAISSPLLSTSQAKFVTTLFWVPRREVVLSVNKERQVNGRIGKRTVSKGTLIRDGAVIFGVD
jgi:hypothetical protein